MDGLFAATFRSLCCTREIGQGKEKLGPGKQLLNILVEFKPELDAWIDEEIGALFGAADDDGDDTLGKVEMKRIEQIILDRGFQFPVRLKNFDTDGSGGLDKKEFTAAVKAALRETDMILLQLLSDKTRAHGLLEQLRLITDRWSQDELIPILLEFGRELGEDEDEGWATAERAKQELERHDANGDGLLDNHEFENLFNILLGKVYLLPNKSELVTSRVQIAAATPELADRKNKTGKKKDSSTSQAPDTAGKKKKAR